MHKVIQIKEEKIEKWDKGIIILYKRNTSGQSLDEVNLRKNLDNAYQITISFFKICFETIADAFSDSPRLGKLITEITNTYLKKN